MICGHQVDRPKPHRQRSSRALEDRARCQGNLVPTTGRHTASDEISLIHKHSGPHIVDTLRRLASGRRPDTFGTPLPWRIQTGIHTGSSEILGAALPPTTPCGLLKQPDKQELP